MNFKVGDKVKGLNNNGYGITNESMYLGEVEETNGNCMKVEVLEHECSFAVGGIYNVLNSKDKFKLVKRKNGKFFKKLPNNFTGTLEVENGFIVEKEILDDAEKEYLKNVIKPFKDKISNISKEPSILGKKFICINFKNEEFMCFPYFKKETMYKGMELEKQYTLKELGLDE